MRDISYILETDPEAKKDETANQIDNSSPVKDISTIDASPYKPVPKKECAPEPKLANTRSARRRKSGRSWQRGQVTVVTPTHTRDKLLAKKREGLEAINNSPEKSPVIDSAQPEEPENEPAHQIESNNNTKTFEKIVKNSEVRKSEEDLVPEKLKIELTFQEKKPDEARLSMEYADLLKDKYKVSQDQSVKIQVNTNFKNRLAAKRQQKQ